MEKMPIPTGTLTPIPIFAELFKPLDDRMGEVVGKEVGDEVAFAINVSEDCEVDVDNVGI